MNLIHRIVILEERVKEWPEPKGTPDFSRLTIFELERLRAINIKATEGGGLDCLTMEEVETGLDLTCRLHNRHPDYHRNRAGEPYPAALNCRGS